MTGFDDLAKKATTAAPLLYISLRVQALIIELHQPKRRDVPRSFARPHSGHKG